MQKLHNLHAKHFYMSFGEKLKQIRKQQQLSQEEMCDKLLMDQPTYSRYETNKSTPTWDIIKRVVDIFNVSFEWLFQTDSKTVIFESGSTNHIDVVQTDNYYAIPKEVIDTMLQQQLSNNLLLQLVVDKLNK